MPFPEDGYQGEDIKDLARAYYEKNGDKLLDVPEAERQEALAQFGLSINLPKMKTDLERYKIHYDNWFYESSLHESGYVKETVDLLAERGWTYEKDGALWLRTADILRDHYRRQGKKEADIEKLDLKDDVLRRANGFTPTSPRTSPITGTSSLSGASTRSSTSGGGPPRPRGPAEGRPGRARPQRRRAAGHRADAAGEAAAGR